MIELLVVIGIILILASIGIPTYRNIKERQKEKRAEAELQIIETVIEKFQDDFGDTPSYKLLEDKLGTDALTSLSDENRGSEVLVACLFSKLPQEEGKEAYLPVMLTGDDGEALGDRDGDGWKELTDPWGRPYVYFHNTDYHSSVVHEYSLLPNEEKDSSATAVSGSEGDYRRLTSFQLWSCGRNQANDTNSSANGTPADDDIRNW